MVTSSQTTLPATPGASPSIGATTHTLSLSSVRLLVILLAQLPLLRASPLFAWSSSYHKREAEPLPAESSELWIYLVVAIALVVIGGAFAGLTIALMGQDEIYLQVIKTSGEGAEKKHAAAVLNLLSRGKHWVLVTLLLGNVITNETLPIVLDRSLGGGWPAVLGSTILIVIFGEIIPQSICVRHGLPIGAWMAPLVLMLMYILAPVAWPTAKLLDRLLGEDHGTVYKKAGLKTLVTLHKSLGQAGEQLNEDEVTIISAVLDLKAKSVGSIMTPMDNVFTMSADTVLDEKTMEVILSAGYSRIPIYAAEDEENFVGMLLVKILITYDPEDCNRVSDFALATLPETRPETSCLDIVNFFQEGKSHMVLVSEYPGENRGSLGVVTLEDVIEELIGEEIIDESDVFIDVHKAIKRLTPAPKFQVPRSDRVSEPDPLIVYDSGLTTDTKSESGVMAEVGESGIDKATAKVKEPTDKKTSVVSSPTRPYPNIRRTSSTQIGANKDSSVKQAAMREHLKHLGPSNRASRPKSTRYNTVKIKPGAPSMREAVGSIDAALKASPLGLGDDRTSPIEVVQGGFAAQGGVGAGLLASAGKDASDGVLALHQGYGSVPRSIHGGRGDTEDSLIERLQESDKFKVNFQPGVDGKDAVSKTSSGSSSISSVSPNSSPTQVRATRRAAAARSGSITENIITAGGIRKTVLELSLTGSGSDGHTSSPNKHSNADSSLPDTKDKKKKRKKRASERVNGKTADERQPLLDRGNG